MAISKKYKVGSRIAYFDDELNQYDVYYVISSRMFNKVASYSTKEVIDNCNRHYKTDAILISEVRNPTTAREVSWLSAHRNILVWNKSMETLYGKK